MHLPTASLLHAKHQQQSQLTQASRYKKNYQSHSKGPEAHASKHGPAKPNSSTWQRDSVGPLNSPFFERDDHSGLGARMADSRVGGVKKEPGREYETDPGEKLAPDLRRSIMSSTHQQSAGHAPKLESDELPPEGSFDYGGGDDDILSAADEQPRAVEEKKVRPKELSPARLPGSLTLEGKSSHGKSFASLN